MKAAVLLGPKDIRFIDDAIDPVISKDEVLIKNRAAGICGSDLHRYRGYAFLNKGKPPFRLIMGHEFSGEILKVGSLVNKNKVKIGDRVTIEPLLPCGNCEFCNVKQYHVCENKKHIGIQHGGGFAEYSKAPMQNVYKIPDHMTFEEASLTDCYAVAVHAVNQTPINIDDTVLIFGAGTIGITLAQVAKNAGAKRVILISRYQQISKKVKESGIEFVITNEKDNLIKKIFEVNDGRRVDIVYECVGGQGDALSQAIEVVVPMGKLVIVGIYYKSPDFNIRMAYSKGLSIIFSNSYSYCGVRKEFKIALDMLSEGRLNSKPLITHRFPLEDVKKAFSVADNKKDFSSIKVLLMP